METFHLSMKIEFEESHNIYLQKIKNLKRQFLKRGYDNGIQN